MKHSRRQWLIDRQLASVGHELRDGLGDWLTRRHNRGVHGQGKMARKTLEDCGVPLPELRREWELQCKAQISVRAHEYSVNRLC